MDDPNMTMEEYIKLEEEKSRRRGRAFNWETATYGKIRVDDDFHDLDLTESLKFYNLCPILVDFVDIALPPRKQRHPFIRVRVFDFGGLLDLMAEGLSARILMKHKDAQGQSVFSSRVWRWLFDIRGPLVHELILEFFSTFRFGDVVLELDTAGALQFQLGGIKISSAGDFLGTAPSYIMIRDPILRLCHRLITCSIAGRSQAPEKVTVTDLFYLRVMDNKIGSKFSTIGREYISETSALSETRMLN
ncbi:hypothetical protein Tco_1052444 [Tanacetum coccineum]